MAFKILQNALYGTYAINSWRFTDGFKICSAAITNSGQRLTKESITFVNDYISKQLDTDPKTFVIASDTDSLYMELTDLLKHRNPDLKYEDREEKIKHLLILTEELQQVANDNLNNISQDLFNMTEAHHFVLKQEVIAEKAYDACDCVILNVEVINTMPKDVRSSIFVIYLNIDIQLRMERMKEREVSFIDIAQRVYADDRQYDGFTNYDLMISNPNF